MTRTSGLEAVVNRVIQPCTSLACSVAASTSRAICCTTACDWAACIACWSRNSASSCSVVDGFRDQNAMSIYDGGEGDLCLPPPCQLLRSQLPCRRRQTRWRRFRAVTRLLRRYVIHQCLHPRNEVAHALAVAGLAVWRRHQALHQASRLAVLNLHPQLDEQKQNRAAVLVLDGLWRWDGIVIRQRQPEVAV